MKRHPSPSALLGTAFVLVCALAVAHQPEVDATQVPGRPATDVSTELPLKPPAIFPMAKSCTTSSDCPNSLCSNGQCGGCVTSSDCRYGLCGNGRCGACSTSSDCKGWGLCGNGSCGGCTTSSDCGAFGSCSGSRCSGRPY